MDKFGPLVGGVVVFVLVIASFVVLQRKLDKIDADIDGKLL